MTIDIAIIIKCVESLITTLQTNPQGATVLLIAFALWVLVPKK